MPEPLPVIRGTLDTLVLKALGCGPMHGFLISTWLEARGGGEIDFLDSALYQSLYRLERRRLIKGSWGVTDNNRRARFYELTAKGRAQLGDETASWMRYSAAITRILATPEPSR